MELFQLIKYLEKHNRDKVVVLGFNNPHSYRGHYEELAFEPVPRVTIGEMLACARGALDRTFTGYKGGDFTMYSYTPVWLSQYGDYGEALGPILLNFMLHKESPDES